jgi:hypothetical protein
LQQFPFISCKVRCRKLKIGRATWLRVPRDDLHLEKLSLCSVLHSLEADQKWSRVTFPRVSPDTRTKSTIWVWTHINRAESWFFWIFSSFVLRGKSRWRSWNSEAKNSIWKVPHFDYLAVAQGSKFCCMFWKAWNIIQPSLSNRLFRIWWNTSVRRVGGKCSKAL